jgi:hypothetical protein
MVLTQDERIKETLKIIASAPGSHSSFSFILAPQRRFQAPLGMRDTHNEVVLF